LFLFGKIATFKVLNVQLLGKTLKLNPKHYITKSDGNTGLASPNKKVPEAG